MTRHAITLLLLAGVLWISGCASAGGSKVWWNPLTWSADRAAVAARVEAKQDANDAALVKQAQVENAKTIEALKAAPVSRPVVVASRTAENAQALLDKAAGSIAVADLTALRATVANLLSENADLRAAGERSQAAAEDRAARLTAENERLKQAAAEAAANLAQAYGKERALANQVRNFYFIVGGLVGLFILGNLIRAAAPLVPALSGASRLVGAVLNPAAEYALHRAETGLAKVGHAVAEIKARAPELAGQFIATLDQHTDSDHQRAIAAAANTAPRL